MASLGLKLFSVRRTLSALNCLQLNGETKRNYNSDDYVKSFAKIPGPSSLPLIGDRWRYFIDFDFKRLHITYWYLYHTFGNLVKETVFRGRVFVHVFHEYDMRKVYENECQTPFRPSHRILEKYRRERPSLYKSVGLFASNGEEWYQFRKLFQDIVYTPEVGEANAEAFEDINDDLIKLISDNMDHKCEVELRPELFKWAVENFGVVTLNRRLNYLSGKNREEAEELYKRTNDICEAMLRTEYGIPVWKYLPTPSYAKFVTAQDYVSRVIKKYLDEEIQNVQNGESPDSVLAKMLAVPDASYRDVFTMVMDMFFAEVQKTLHVTEFLLYNLCFNFIIQMEVQKEVLEHLPTKTSKVTKELLERPLIQNILKESLRHDPVTVGIKRVLPSDLILSGYHIPAGTLVFLQHHVACNLIDQNYSHTPQFLPERWLDVQDLPTYLYFPFGTGPRKCIGQSLAEREVLMLTSKILRNFRIETHNLKSMTYVRNIAVETNSMLSNVPAERLRIRFMPLADGKYR